MINDDWRPFTWHCVNCGATVTGYKNSRGDIKVECRTCHTVMVRTIKNARQDCMNIFAPQGTVHIYEGQYA